MSYWLLLAPVVSALMGWFLSWVLLRMIFRPYYPQNWLGLTIQGLIPARQLSLSERVADLATRELVSFKAIEEKILDPTTLEKITPEIEMHIDYFLRVKLKDAMPMVAMFVGDKTIIQLKEVFMTEMKTLFPEIMKSYVNELQTGFNINEKITQKLSAISPSQIESFISQTFQKELRYVKITGTFFGLVIGIMLSIINLLMMA